MNDIVRIYQAQSVYEANILSQALAEAGITAHTEGGALTGWMSDASAGALGHVAIVVAESDETRAREELDRLLRERDSQTDTEPTDAE